MHLDTETLERALHGELDPAARATVADHLASCAACADRLAEAGPEERGLFKLLEELDHEPPAIDWDAVKRDSRSGGSGRSLIAASVAFLLVAAGILYAIPGSPLRAWLDAVARQDPEAVTPAPVPGASELSGIAVQPADPFEVRFAAFQQTGQVRVTLVPSPRLELKVLGETVELESGIDRLVVANEGSTSSYELQVPRVLGSLRVRVAGNAVFEKQGERIRTGRSPDSTGTYVIDLSRPGT